MARIDKVQTLFDAWLGKQTLLLSFTRYCDECGCQKGPLWYLGSNIFCRDCMYYFYTGGAREQDLGQLGIAQGDT